MARINIEESIYKDMRFIRLAMALGGDIDRALGTMVRTWALAQKWYLKTPDRMIPKADWDAQQINQAVIDIGLAELIGDRVRVRGADEQFGWLLQKSEAGKSNRETKGKTRQRPSGAVKSRRVVTTSSSSSSSVSVSDSDSVSNKENTPAASAPVPAQLLIPAYCEAFKKKYGVNPDIGGKDAGIAKRIMAKLPEKWPTYLQEFFVWDDWGAKNSRHSLACFEASTNKLKIQLEGNGVLNLDRRKTFAEERGDYNAEMHRKIVAGEI